MLSKQVKHLPEDGTIPRQAQFTCRTCKTWFGSRTGYYGHLKKNPGHEIWNVAQNRPVLTYPSKPDRVAPSSQNSPNGHRAVTTVLLQSAFAKLREEVTAELDRLEAQLFPAEPQERQPRKTYVAR